MHDERLGIHLVFNGEIYNFQELRPRLESLGYQFRTNSDTEVLLAAYGAWGCDCVNELNGMYAFAVFDERTGTIFAARDRAGEKPFFYWHSNGRFWFASELKALMAHPDFPRQLNPEAVEYYFAYGYVPGELCILRGVKKLPPAHALEYDVAADRMRVWRYWNLPNGEKIQHVDEQQLLDELDQLLEASVRRQLVADVPVGVLLSGGVDSSLIATMAVRCSTAPVRTFTISFPGHGSFDEAPHARRVAQHLGTQHTELAAEPNTVELLPLLAAQFDEPIADSSMLPTYMVSRLIRQYATVALGGDGGDELFGGYLHHAFLVRVARSPALLPSRLSLAGRNICRRLVPVGVRGRNFLLALLSTPDLRAAQVNMYFDAGSRDYLLEPLRKHFMAPDCERWKEEVVRQFTTAARKSTSSDFLTYLPEDILVKVDRASMLASLEVRSPFLDRAVVEFAFGKVPDHLRVTAGQRKILTRKLLARLMPPDVNITRKHGFSIPLDNWFRGLWGEKMTEILLTAPSELFSERAIRRLIRYQRSGLRNAHRMFAITIFELWRRHYHISL